MAILRPVIQWPGVASPVSVEYTVSHGLTPGRAVLTFNPQRTPPAGYGTLVIGDGVRELVLRDCAAAEGSNRIGTDGWYSTWFILDRRWRWQTGRIDGEYNRKDDRGKLVPWQIASPTELALKCLERAGEPRYQLRLPTGLSSRDIPKVNRLLHAGETFPQTLANPYCLWDALPPMVALSRLAAEFDHRVVWDPATDTVGVGPLGGGDGLPAGGQSVAYDVTGVSARPLPAAVCLAGAHVPHNVRIPLEATGTDWDGREVAIDELSFTPRGVKDRVQKVQCYRTVTDAGEIKITVNGREFKGGSGSPTAQLDAIQAAAAGAGLPVEVRRVGDLNLAFFGLEPGVRFALAAEGVQVRLHQAAEKKDSPDWAYSGGPPLFPNVSATSRLSFTEAQQLAQKTVFRRYRLLIDRPAWTYPTYRPWNDYANLPIKTDRDPATNLLTVRYPKVVDPGPDSAGRVRIPDGKVEAEDGSRRNRALKLVRRQQLTLLPHKTLYLEPRERELAGQAAPVNREFGHEFGVEPPFYNGYFQYQPATAHGTFARECSDGYVVYNSERAPMLVGHDIVGGRLYVPFTVVPTEQLIEFASPVFRKELFQGVTGYTEAQLWVETAVLFDFADTGQRRRSEFVLPLGGPAPADWAIRDDILVDVTGVYDKDDRFKLVGANTDLYDARQRAGYYLAGRAATYQVKAAQTRKYNGIFPVGLTGKVQQVSYEAGVDGVFTTAGLDTEFAWNVPKFAERRMPENLPPNREAMRVNDAEARSHNRQYLDDSRPK